MSRGSLNVLGAGLCGSLLAILLARRGYGVTLWERQADPRRSAPARGRSINLALAARGIRALRHAGMFERVAPLLLPMRGRMIHHPDGATELQPYGQREHEVIHSVSRAQLNRVLLDAAEEHGVETRFDGEAEAFDARAGEVRLRDGRTIAADPLIAADGAGSVIRRSYGDGSRIAPTESLLPHGYKELTLPSGRGGEHLLAPDALHIWPRGGYMLIALPNPGGDFTLTLFLPKSGDPSFDTLTESVAIDRFFAQQFGDAHALLPSLTGEFAANPVGILGTVRCRHWHDGGNVLLIGDAAHAIVPFHGQGMNLAFEDCVVLDRILEAEQDWSETFERFETTQLGNANAIADMALDNYVEMRDRVRDPGYVLRKSLAFELERRLPDRFIPRYSMVMFHHEIPYATARERGERQAGLLGELTAGKASLGDIDLDDAERRAKAALPPLVDTGPATDRTR